MNMENNNLEEARRAVLRAYLPVLEKRVATLIGVLDRYMKNIDPENMTPVQERTLTKLQNTRESIDRSLFNIQKYLFKLNEDTVVCPF